MLFVFDSRRTMIDSKSLASSNSYKSRVKEYGTHTSLLVLESTEFARALYNPQLRRNMLLVSDRDSALTYHYIFKVILKNIQESYFYAHCEAQVAYWPSNRTVMLNKYLYFVMYFTAVT